MSTRVNNSMRALRWFVLVSALIVLVVGPFLWFGPELTERVTDLLTSNGQRELTALLLAALLATDILLPVPSSLISTSAGYLLGLVYGTLTSLTGMTIGCTVGYWLGARSVRPGAILMLGAEDIDRLEQMTCKYGDWAIVICRSVPVLAEVSVLFAGISRMPKRRFLLLVTLSNLGISSLYAAVGALALSLDSFLLAFASALVLPAIAILVARRAKN